MFKKTAVYLFFPKAFLLLCGVGLMLIVFARNSSEGSALLAEQEEDSIWRNIPVLMYHHILPEAENIKYKDNAVVLNLEKFEEHIKYLYENGFSSITPEDVRGFLYENKKLPEKSVWLTFDDGYYSNFTHAYPILKKYGMKATIFVITSFVTDEVIPDSSDELIYLNWQEMSEYTDVFSFGSHTDDMHQQDEEKNAFLQVKSEDEILKDMEKSYSYSDINTKYAFSYPYGKYNEKTIECLQKLNVQIAVTVQEGCMNPMTNPFEIPRYNIYNTMTLDKFINIVGKSE